MVDRRFVLVISLCIVSFLWGCSNQPQNSTQNPEPSIPVTLLFDVFNHTQGFLKSFKKNILSDEDITIRIMDLGIEGVDEERIVIREGRFGERVALSKTGEVTFKAPDSNQRFTVYVMNASSGADYRKVDTWIETNQGILEYTPDMKWRREDRNSFEGPEDVIQDAFDQLNQALDYSWAKYGSFQRADHKKESHFGVGYGFCRNQFGWHSPYWAGVNPGHCSTYEARLSTFLEELFELVTRLDDIGGKDTASVITNQDTGEFNDIGRDLLAYVFIKDKKSSIRFLR
jgi:hypothetical protein